jgi:hypothetical protein
LGREHTTARQVRDCGRVERGHVARSSQVPVYSGGRNSGPAWDVCDASKNSPDMRDCGYSATLACARLRQPRLRPYTPPQSRNDVVQPSPGRALGRGFVPQCPGDSSGTPDTVYRVPGVPPDVAVMARTADDQKPGQRRDARPTSTDIG